MARLMWGQLNTTTMKLNVNMVYSTEMPCYHATSTLLAPAVSRQAHKDFSVLDYLAEPVYTIEQLDKVLIR